MGLVIAGRLSGIACISVLAFAMLCTSVSSEEADIDGSASFSSSDSVSVYIYEQSYDSTFSLDSKIIARTPRLNGKPFSISTSTLLKVSIDRRPKEGLKALLNRFSPFKVECLVFYYPLTAEETAIVASFEGAKRLELENQRLGKQHLEGLKEAKNLRELLFRGCEFTSSDVLQAIKGFTSLKELSLDRCRNFSGFISELPNLKSLLRLTLAGDEMTDEDITHLREVRSVVELVISSDNITDVGMEFIKSLGRLERISIQGTKLTGKCISYFSHFHYLNNLELIDITDISKYIRFGEGSNDYERLAFIRTDIKDKDIERMQDLLWKGELVLIGNKFLTATGYFFLSRIRMQRIYIDVFGEENVALWFGSSELSIRRCRVKKKYFTPTDLTTEFYAGLQFVSITGRVFGASFQNLIKNNAQIMDVELINSQLGCELGDSVLLQLSEMKRVKRLRIVNLEPSSDKWIAELKNLPVLEYLCLNSVTCISDSTIYPITKMEYLRELDLRGNPDITANGIRKLVSMDGLICFNPTPEELKTEHHRAVTTLLRHFEGIMKEEKRRHGGYYRNGIKAIPQVGLDTRDGRFGYSFRYFSNSNDDDASQYILLAFPNLLDEGRKAFYQSESGGIFEYDVIGEEDIAAFRLLKSSEIKFDAEPENRIIGKTFTRRKD